jgi:hypothetical protein
VSLTGVRVQVHFPDKSMVWILHAGHWVVRLCWRHCFDPKAWIRGAQSPRGGALDGSPSSPPSTTLESDAAPARSAPHSMPAFGSECCSADAAPVH